MAIELYYTLASGKKPRKWRDSFISIRGSLAIFFCFMSYMEQKYLPSLPPLFPSKREKERYHSRWSMSICRKEGEEHPMQEVWDLQLSPKATPAERLTMASMMDRSYFKVSDFPKVAEAWLTVSNDMGNKDTEQAFNSLILACEKLIRDKPGICSIAVHWSSVVNFFESYGKTDKDCYDFVEDNRLVEERLLKERSNI